MSRPHRKLDSILRLRTLLPIVVALISAVLGLTIVFLPGHSATARPKLSCHLKAYQDRMPMVVAPGETYQGRPLYVVGRCTFPTPGFSLELKPHASRGPDPRVLLLDAIVHAPTYPAMQVLVAEDVRFEFRRLPPIDKVIILPDNLVLVVGGPS
jgi:hypothetical protein